MPITRISLSEQARDALLESIVSGKLAAGTRLTEEYLSSEFGISRTPVRDALSRLESDGLIERLPKRGYQVKQLDAQAVAELLDCRIEVELKILAENYTSLDQEKLLALRRELENIDPFSPEALARARQLDDLLHNIINQCCRNRYWQDIHRKLLKQRLPFRDLRNTGSGESINRLKNERLDLLASLIKGDKEQSLLALRKHLESGRSEILKVMKKLD